MLTSNIRHLFANKKSDIGKSWMAWNKIYQDLYEKLKALTEKDACGNA